jgi:hypothetical protein
MLIVAVALSAAVIPSAVLSGSAYAGNSGPVSAHPPKNAGKAHPSGSQTVRAAPLREVKQTLVYGRPRSEWTVSWDNDPEATIVFSKERDGGVDVSAIYRGNQPPGTAGQMLADSLKDPSVNIPRPTSIKISSIENPPTVAALQGGKSATETVLGKTIIKAAQELGAEVDGWDPDEEGEYLPTIKAILTYPMAGSNN